MREDVEEFYSKCKVPIESMIKIGKRRGLSSSSIKTAAEKVYEDNRIHKFFGTEIDNIRVAWRVFEEAKHVDVSREREEVDRVEELKKMTIDLSKTIEKLNETKAVVKQGDDARVGELRRLTDKLTDSMKDVKESGKSLEDKRVGELAKIVDGLNSQIDKMRETLTPWYVKLWRNIR
jgi:Skp family chaperone for outer membrane proteins